MSVEAYVIHQIPGRVRLTIPAAKGRPELLQQIVGAAAAARDVKSVQANPVTGSVLVHYAPNAYESPDALASLFGDSTLRVSIRSSRKSASRRPRRAHRETGSEPSTAAKNIASFFRSLDQEIRETTDNEIDLKVILPLVAAALGLVAFRRKAATPLWLTLLIFAFHSFLTLHNAAGAEEVGGLALNNDAINAD